MFSYKLQTPLTLMKINAKQPVEMLADIIHHYHENNALT